MGFGLTVNGLVIKRLTDIKEEIEASLRSELGAAINLLPTELLGQIVGIVSEREALVWELAEDVNNSTYPETANGISLDNVVSITGIQRLAATKATGRALTSNPLTVFGDLGIFVAAGALTVSVDGNSEAVFVNSSDFTVEAGTDEIQDIDFTDVPDDGSWSLRFDGEETTLLTDTSTNTDVENALNALSGLGAVTVTGNFTSGFTVTFATLNGSQPQQLIQVATNILEISSADVDISIVETVEGVLPNIDVDVEAVNAGDIIAPAGTLTVIENPITGILSVTNAADIDNGKEVETDAELRIRRLQTLATAGAATVDAITARLLEIDEVTAARTFENDSDDVNAFGRPSKSFECVVEGGLEAEIADAIWQVKPAGITTFGDLSEVIQDSQGFDHTINFSRPTPIPIYIDISMATNDDYPVGGDAALKEELVAYAQAEFSIGDTIKTFKLYSPLEDNIGVIDATITIGTAPSPVSSANIPIQDDEIGDFDTSRVTIL